MCCQWNFIEGIEGKLLLLPGVGAVQKAKPGGRWGSLQVRGGWKLGGRGEDEGFGLVAGRWQGWGRHVGDWKMEVEKSQTIKAL